MMEYECQNAGCDVGEFEDRDEEWYWGKGMDTPRNCRTCREWKREQVDEVFTCSACGNKRYISRGVKIMHHKNDGPWEDPEYCLSCERYPDRRKRSQDSEDDKDEFGRRQRQPGREKERKRERQIPATIHPVELALENEYHDAFTSVTPFSIPDTADGFRGVPDRRFGNRYQHLVERHHDADFAREGFSVDDAIQHLSALAASDDPAVVAEFQDGDYVVKYDKVNGVVGIVNPESETPVTGYPKSPRSVAGKITRRAWVPR